MQKKTIFTGFTIFILSLIILPHVASTFTNQHTWQQTNEVACSSCHADIKMEIDSPENYHHNPELLGVKNTDEACKYCHQTQFGIDLGEHNDWGVENDPQRVHTAITVECLDCHGNSTAYDDPKAVDVAVDFDAQTVESHKPLFDEAVSRSLMAGANEACIACHTGIALQNGANFITNPEINLTAQSTENGWVVQYRIKIQCNA